MSDAAIAALPTFVYELDGDDAQQQADCAVCLGQVEAGETVPRLPKVRAFVPRRVRGRLAARALHLPHVPRRRRPARRRMRQEGRHRGRHPSDGRGSATCLGSRGSTHAYFIGKSVVVY
jgi:hypothetical protein